MFDESERRAELRHKTLKGGRIIFNGGRSSISCKVRNLSPIGARLEVVTVIGVPNTFDLSVGAEIKACRVVWRTLKELGIEFVR